MGWLWSDSAKGTNNTDKTLAGAPTPASKPAAQPEAGYSDPEIAKFMSQLQTEFGSKPSEPTAVAPPLSTKPTTQTSAEPSKPSSSSWGSFWGASAQSADTLPPEPALAPSTNPSQEPAATPQHQQPPSPPAGTPQRLDPISESLLPTTMSCRQALDAAFYCQSPGGQWNAVYREGNVRSCSSHWDDLFFCMRTRTMGGPVKEEAVRDHYRQKELAKYGPGRPSSADVWEPRQEKVPVGSAFREKYEKPDISDEEWRVLEIQRRKAIQEALAAEEKGR
ncbi:uncharacterized protein JN550_006055 [Neoarthrinium moseri]|uniref:uncharacterized protein n=1 Tax=Neoarthrinium moseri TaxID=1658444 RepID=UPI001FDCF870|nr:uncharacterized protein JN550_006055 [Neoarthrinium moseri]KAI1869068.1 hypothetical protein JN550_006055 [Neoarthrinium moseri]